MTTLFSYDYLKGRLRINEHQLDLDVAEQPALFQQVNEQLADAREALDKAKLLLKQQEGVAQVRVRKAFDSAGSKYTETSVAASVAGDPNVIQANDEVVYATKREQLWVGLRDAYIQRQFMVKHMADLFAAQYFQKSSVESNSEIAVDARELIKRSRQANPVPATVAATKLLAKPLPRLDTTG